MDAEIQMAYAIWRFNMWSAGFGSYEDIEWAQGWLLLRPYKHPGRVWSVIVKWLIERHNKSVQADLCQMCGSRMPRREKECRICGTSR